MAPHREGSTVSVLGWDGGVRWKQSRSCQVSGARKCQVAGTEDDQGPRRGVSGPAGPSRPGRFASWSAPTQLGWRRGCSVARWGAGSHPLLLSEGPGRAPPLTLSQERGPWAAPGVVGLGTVANAQKGNSQSLYPHSSLQSPTRGLVESSPRLASLGGVASMSPLCVGLPKPPAVAASWPPARRSRCRPSTPPRAHTSVPVLSGQQLLAQGLLGASCTLARAVAPGTQLSSAGAVPEPRDLDVCWMLVQLGRPWS